MAGRRVWLLLLVVLIAVRVGGIEQSKCKSITEEWVRQQEPTLARQGDIHERMFFLHVPRTAGRTYYSCFMRQAFPPSKRGPKSYDNLRIDVALPGAAILASHDDYSVVELFPSSTAVITQWRDPVDRLLSSYEFAIEVAARDFRRPVPKKMSLDKVNTRNVWPWSYLIGLMEGELHGRATAMNKPGYQHPDATRGVWRALEEPKDGATHVNTLTGATAANLSAEQQSQLEGRTVNAYDNEGVLSLQDYVRHPMTQELIHNGATFQLLGITNYTAWDGTQDVRECAVQWPQESEALIEFAERRLRSLGHVGVYEQLEDSVAALASSLGIRWANKSYKTADAAATKYAPHNSTDGPIVATNPAGKERLLRRGVFIARRELQRRQAIIAAKRLGLHSRQVWEAARAQVEETRMEVRALQRALLELNGPEAGVLALHDHTGSAYSSTPDKDLLTEKAVSLAYHECIWRTRNKDKGRDARLASIKIPGTNSTIKFSREARAELPPALLAEIREKNAWDTRLHAVAIELLEKEIATTKGSGAWAAIPPKPSGFQTRMEEEAAALNKRRAEAARKAEQRRREGGPQKGERGAMQNKLQDLRQERAPKRADRIGKGRKPAPA